jgi:hypothetical protein
MLPARIVRRHFVAQGALYSDEFYVFSSSLDETVRIHRFNVLEAGTRSNNLHAHQKKGMFVPAVYKPDPYVVLRRQLNEVQLGAVHQQQEQQQQQQQQQQSQQQQQPFASTAFAEDEYDHDDQQLVGEAKQQQRNASSLATFGSLAPPLPTNSAAVAVVAATAAQPSSSSSSSGLGSSSSETYDNNLSAFQKVVTNVEGGDAANDGRSCERCSIA